MCQSSSYVLLDPFFSLALIRRELITAVCVPQPLYQLSAGLLLMWSVSSTGGGGREGDRKVDQTLIILRFLDLR